MTGNLDRAAGDHRGHDQVVAVEADLAGDGAKPLGALRRERLEEPAVGLAALPARPRLRFVQDQQTSRPGEAAGLFHRRHLVLTAHLPPGLHHAVAGTGLDGPGRASVVWPPLAGAAALHLCPALGPALEQAAHHDPATGGPLLLPAVTDASYRWC